MESFRKIGAVYAVIDDAGPDALAAASLPELSTAICDRMAHVTSPGDILGIINLVDKCDAMLDRLALALPDES